MHRPGDVDGCGNIVSASPQIKYSRGVVWVTKEQADAAAKFGWVKVDATTGDMVKVKRP